MKNQFLRSLIIIFCLILPFVMYDVINNTLIFILFLLVTLTSLVFFIKKTTKAPNANKDATIVDDNYFKKLK